MREDLRQAADRRFDVAVIGGGIHGLACARDAALRGASVVLLEAGDFGAATSSQSARIAHCGMRYLQHLDFRRVRESVRERCWLHQAAPHLIRSQPFLLPLYGHGVKGREALWAYLKAYDLMSPERTRFEDPYRRVPGSQVVGREEVLRMFPGVDTAGLTAGAVWYEGQMRTERLTVAFLNSAVAAGAVCVSGARVAELLLRDGRVHGVAFEDVRDGGEGAVEAAVVVNAAGPWAEQLLERSGAPLPDSGLHPSRAFSLVADGPPMDVAVAFPIRPMYRDTEAVLDKKTSLQFAIPWSGRTLYASLHLPWAASPEGAAPTEEDVARYVELIQEGFPGAGLERSQVRHVHWGVLPARAAGSAEPLRHPAIVDHAGREGVTGLVTVMGVKFTTARLVAEQVVDLVMERIGGGGSPAAARETPLWGGSIPRFEAYVADATARLGHRFPAETVAALVGRYGTEHEAVAALAEADPALGEPLPGHDAIAAEVVHAVRSEAAGTLEDVLVRRLEIGSAGRPSDGAVELAADVMAGELGWDGARRAAEVAQLDAVYRWTPPPARP